MPYDRIRKACLKFSAYMILSSKISIAEKIGYKWDYKTKKYIPEHDRFKNIFKWCHKKGKLEKFVKMVEKTELDEHGRIVSGS